MLALKKDFEDYNSPILQGKRKQWPMKDMKIVKNFFNARGKCQG